MMINNEIKKTFTDTDRDAIEITDQSYSRIKIRPMYFELGFSPSPRIFGRRAILTRLIEASAHLPSEYGFLIWDVYRPRFVQEKLFNWMREEIRKKSPHLNEEENDNETRKYISPPSKIGEAYCPPHLSGGAIDLTLYQIETGNALEMGTAFDDCTERAHSHYFNLKPSLTAEEALFKKRRLLLLTAMEQVGFVHYQYEWWHFDIGNLFWSRKTGQPAVFEPLFGDKEWP